MSLNQSTALSASDTMPCSAFPLLADSITEDNFAVWASDRPERPLYIFWMKERKTVEDLVNAINKHIMQNGALSRPEPLK